MTQEGDSKSRGVHGEQPSPAVPPQNYYYGTFQGVANYQPQPTQPVTGFPQPVAPPAVSGSAPIYHPHGPQAFHGNYRVIGYAGAQEPYHRGERLPCCGLGLGWFLFISGFFLGAIPWYIGAFILLCIRLDHREKPGLIACTIAALLAAFAVTLGVTKVTHSW